MKRFTNSIRLSVQNKNWFSALFLTLCLPDICGSIETPNEGAQKRYERWFNDNLKVKYPAELFSSQDCYYFRCSCLHQGIDNHAKLSSERIHFIVPPTNNSIVHLNSLKNVIQMQIDTFCHDMAEAVDNWYEKVKNESVIRGRIDSLIKIHTINSLRPFISFGE